MNQRNYTQQNCKEIAKEIVFSNEHGTGLAKTTAQQCIQSAWLEVACKLQHMEFDALNHYMFMYNDKKHNGGIDISSFIDFISFVTIARECYRLIKEQIDLLECSGEFNENLTDYLKAAFKKASERKLINIF
jgi:hypothetical protein